MESGGLEVRLGPGQPIREDPRAPTGQELLPLLVGQGEVPSEGIQGLLVAALAAVLEVPKDGEHERLEVWDRHSLAGQAVRFSQRRRSCGVPPVESDCSLFPASQLLVDGLWIASAMEETQNENHVVLQCEVD